jgi:hypothetical protein
VVDNRQLRGGRGGEGYGEEGAGGGERAGRGLAVGRSGQLGFGSGEGGVSWSRPTATGLLP